MLSIVDSSLSQPHPRSAAEVKCPGSVACVGLPPKGWWDPQQQQGEVVAGAAGGTWQGTAGPGRRGWPEPARVRGGLPAFDRCC